MNNKAMLSFLFISTIVYAAPDEVVKSAKDDFLEKAQLYEKYFGRSKTLQACVNTMGTKECDAFYQEELERRRDYEKRCSVRCCFSPGDEPDSYYVWRSRCSFNDALHGFKGCHERAWAVYEAAKRIENLHKNS